MINIGVGSPIIDRLPLIITVVLFVLLSYSIGSQGYAFFQEYIKPDPVAVESKVVEVTAKVKPESKIDLASLHLFGNPGKKEKSRPEPKVIPITNLKIVLRGVSAVTNPAQGTALLEWPGKEVDLYRVGDQLAGKAKLESVYSDRIVLIRSGQKETLYFPEYNS